MKNAVMKSRLLPLLLLLLSLFGLVGNASAQAYWREVPPDERRQMRQQMREHWRTLPPEEQQRLRDERQERRENFRRMAPDDRSRLRDELRSRRSPDDGAWQRHGPANGPRSDRR